MACIVRTLNPSACLMGALGLIGRPDPLIGVASAVARFHVSPSADGLLADLAPPVQPGEPAPPGALLMPLGHQDRSADGAICCPALADDEAEDAPPRQLRLAAVAVPVDSRQRVLLTRRPSTMRTFPGAWVLPGGGVDASDGSIAATALRELEEETGIAATPADVSAPYCLWESCYPVSYDGWARRRAEGGRVSHYLIAFVVVTLSDEALARSRLWLEPSECDYACWVPLRDVADTLCTPPGAGCTHDELSYRAVSSALPRPAAGNEGGPPSDADAPRVSGALLAGVYPNAAGQGVGRGHLYALRELLAQREKDQTG
jgi:8-oxo-dGTP pyrophosphatase MutT (NUDIX family)